LEVLRAKERELVEVKRQVEALRLVAPLLEGDDKPRPDLVNSSLLKDGGFSA
jgi:hypothetical protein